MAPGQLLVLIACMTLVAARIVHLEKLALSVTDDSKGDADHSMSEILTSLLSDHGYTSNDLQECSNGSCKFCKHKFVEACVVVSIEGGQLMFEITINGQSFFKAEVAVSKTMCKSISFIPDVKEICIEFTDIDLKNMAGCVTVEVKLKWMIPLKFKIGCFKIPHADVEMQGTDDAGIQQETPNEVLDILKPETVLKFLSLTTKN